MNEAWEEYAGRLECAEGSASYLNSFGAFKAGWDARISPAQGDGERRWHVNSRGHLVKDGDPHDFKFVQEIPDYLNALEAELKQAREERDRFDELFQQYHKSWVSANNQLALLKPKLDALEAIAEGLAAAGIRLHDCLDDANADRTKADDECSYCGANGYDGNGLRHADDCILQEWRAALTAWQEHKEMTK